MWMNSLWKNKVVYNLLILFYSNHKYGLDIWDLNVRFWHRNFALTPKIAFEVLDVENTHQPCKTHTSIWTCLQHLLSNSQTLIFSRFSCVCGVRTLEIFIHCKTHCVCIMHIPGCSRSHRQDTLTQQGFIYCLATRGIQAFWL